MTIKDDLLPKHFRSRPGDKRQANHALVMHWTGAPMQKAEQTRAYFESLKNTVHYGSSHYIVDLDGTILRIIPEGEVAYHCGTNKVDPVSKRVYTDLARKLFKPYCCNWPTPNYCTIGVEMCTTDAQGNFTPQTLQAATELAADIMVRYHLNIDRLITHHDVVGWKDCPRLWVAKPSLFEAFKDDVAELMAKIKVESME